MTMYLPQDTTAVAQAVGFDADDIKQRKAFFGIDDRTAVLPPHMRAQMALDEDMFTDAFYDHLLSFPALRKLLPDDATVARLKKSQCSYFTSLTAGDYGPDYIADRLRTGLVHQRIGLEPHWYIGAYGKYLTWLMPMVRELAGDNTEAFHSAFDTLMRVVCFDMSLALDAYMQAERREILQLKNYAEQIITGMPCGLMVLDSAGAIRSMNGAMGKMLGIPDVAAAKGSPLRAHVDSRALHEAIARAIASQSGQTDLLTFAANAHTPARHLQYTISPTVLDGRPMLLVIAEDVTRYKSIEEDLLHLASHDALTGLPNRTLLRERLARAITVSHRTNRMVAVMFIDLDRFKNINDSLGHGAGDKVIVETARRLSGCLRDCDTVARLGGDEFVVVLGEVARIENVARVAQKILAAMRVPMELHGQEVSTLGSIGVSMFPKDGMDIETLLMNADVAMYQAKDAGRGTFQFYAQEMNAQTLERLRLEGGLRRALERSEFVLHYQPQVDLRTGAVVGFEALLRWQPPGQKMVLPSDFIPIAEDTGLIVPIGEWVIRSACAQLRAWHDMGYSSLHVAVNLSARQFQQPDLAEMVAAILEQTGCDPSMLELELTESMIMKSPEVAIATQRKLTAMGVKLAIDDFGTGYSSLNYLKRFPIHALKIDQSFVRDLTTDQNDATIAKAVIALAHSMQLKVLAEGVETPEQLAFLREHHCDLMQGYHFSKPVPADQVPGLL